MENDEKQTDCECEEPLEEFKKNYKSLSQKYDLPDYEMMIEDFDIEKVTEKSSSFLIREIRRLINEKLSAYLHLFETFLNPTTPPMFIFSLLKNIDVKEKKQIKEIYKKLSKIQIETIRLDTIYNEKNEAEFVKAVFKQWQEMKKAIFSLIDSLEEKSKNNLSKNNNGYFG